MLGCMPTRTTSTPTNRVGWFPRLDVSAAGFLWWGRSQMKTRVGQLVAGSRQTLADMASAMPELPVFGPPVNKLETESGQ